MTWMLFRKNINYKSDCGGQREVLIKLDIIKYLDKVVQEQPLEKAPEERFQR